MEDLEWIRSWLLTYPGWDESSLQVDFSEGKPESTGLFYNGTREISRQIDVQGNALVCRRHSFTLRRNVPDHTGSGAPAKYLMDLHGWISRENTLGNAPALGCLPERNRIAAGEGGLVKVTAGGVAVYEMKLWVEFYTYEEGWVDDGSNI